MSVNNKNRYFFWVTKIIHEKGGRREKSILKNCSMKKVEKNIIQVKNDLGVCYVYIPEFSMDMCHICGWNDDSYLRKMEDLVMEYTVETLPQTGAPIGAGAVAGLGLMLTTAGTVLVRKRK